MRWKETAPGNIKKRNNCCGQFYVPNKSRCVVNIMIATILGSMTPAVINQFDSQKVLKWGEFCNHPHFQQEFGRLVIGFPTLKNPTKRVCLFMIATQSPECWSVKSSYCSCCLPHVWCVMVCFCGTSKTINPTLK